MFGTTFAGAKYRYLAANVIDEATGKTLFAPYAIKYFDAGNGKRVGIAFIGAVLKDTPTVTTAFGVRGLRFTDEATAINALLPAIYAQGVHAVVVLIHQGIATKVGYNDRRVPAPTAICCRSSTNSTARFAWCSADTRTTPISVRAGRDEQPARLLYERGRYGQIVSDINVSLDVATGAIANISARNELVVNDKGPNPLAATLPAVSPDAGIAALVARYVTAPRPSSTA